MSTLSSIRPDLFRDAMASFASGITAITSERNGVAVGMIATSVCSVSIDPASLLVCVNKTASMHSVIFEKQAFNVSLLSTDHIEVAERFAASKSEERFDWTLWKRDARGIPELRDAVVMLRCNLIATHDAYTHSIFIGQIGDARVHAPTAGQCLLWHRHRFAGSGVGVDSRATRPPTL